MNGIPTLTRVAITSRVRSAFRWRPGPPGPVDDRSNEGRAVSERNVRCTADASRIYFIWLPSVTLWDRDLAASLHSHLTQRIRLLITPP